MSQVILLLITIKICYNKLGSIIMLIINDIECKYIERVVNFDLYEGMVVYV